MEKNRQMEFISRLAIFYAFKRLTKTLSNNWMIASVIDIPCAFKLMKVILFHATTRVKIATWNAVLRGRVNDDGLSSFISWDDGEIISQADSADCIGKWKSRFKIIDTQINSQWISTVPPLRSSVAFQICLVPYFTSHDVSQLCKWIQLVFKFIRIQYKKASRF